MSGPHPSTTNPHSRGFAYFCEETLQYIGGVRAWLFFGPYLLGAIWLEPALGGQSVHGFSPWLVLVAWLLIFPPVWRALLLATGLWRKAPTLESLKCVETVGLEPTQVLRDSARCCASLRESA
jgi:hypothetical protein